MYGRVARQQLLVHEYHAVSYPVFQIFYLVAIGLTYIIVGPHRTADDVPRALIPAKRSTRYYYVGERIYLRLDGLIRVLAVAILLPAQFHIVHKRLVARQFIPPERHELRVAVAGVEVVLPQVGALALIIIGVAIGDVEIPK